MTRLASWYHRITVQRREVPTGGALERCPDGEKEKEGSNLKQLCGPCERVETLGGATPGLSTAPGLCGIWGYNRAFRRFSLRDLSRFAPLAIEIEICSLLRRPGRPTDWASDMGLV